jgi:GNAT superfamily N-acetyltransferase
MSQPGFTISPVKVEDVPAIAEIAESSFEDDRHTQMKGMGDGCKFDMKEYTLRSMPQYLKRPHLVVLKAVDNETGEIMGVCNWGFKRIPPEEMPVVEGRVQPPADSPAPPKEEEKEDNEEAFETDPIERLQSRTSKHLHDFMEQTMGPDGVRCLYIMGITVSPQFQGRGVGKALLRFGTDFCDEKGVFAWVHSSEGAWGMYEKCGFQIVEKLDIDLDEYAPVPPPDEGPDAKWGHYVFQYMKYFPRKA